MSGSSRNPFTGSPTDSSRAGPASPDNSREQFPLLLVVMLIVASILSASWHYFNDDDGDSDEIVRFDMRISFEGFVPDTKDLVLSKANGGKDSSGALIDPTENTTMWSFDGTAFDITQFPTSGSNKSGDAVWLLSHVTMKKPTILKAMETLGKRCGFPIASEHYPMFDSTLVTGIAGIDNNQDDSGHYWVYWIDGEYGTVSADNHRIEDGSLIEWKFEKY